MAWLRERWKGRIILKGVLDPEDATRAVSEGLDGILVSNHGGRQLDGTLATIEALPRIADELASLNNALAALVALLRERVAAESGVPVAIPSESKHP